MVVNMQSTVLYSEIKQQCCNWGKDCNFEAIGILNNKIVRVSSTFLMMITNSIPQSTLANSPG